MRQLIYIAFLVLSCTTIVLGQQPCYWSLTVDDGLPSNEVYEMYQDTQKYIWIATDKGLCRYDGQQFKYYKNAQQKGLAVSRIHTDLQGRIWVQSFKNELFYVDKDSLTYFSPLSKLPKGQFGNYHISQFGDIWLYGIQGAKTVLYVYRQAKKEWEEIRLKNPTPYPLVIFQITEKKDGTIVCMGYYGFYEIKPNGQISYIGGEKLLEQYPDELIYAPNLGLHHMTFIPPKNQLYTINGTVVWMAINDRPRIYEYHDRDSLLVAVNYNKNFQPNHTVKAHALSNGEVWLSGFNEGAAIMYHTDKNQPIDTNLVLFSDETVSGIMLDHEGNYWVSTLKNGIHIIPSLAIQTYTNKNSFLNGGQVRRIAKHSETELIVASEDDVLCIYDVAEQQQVDNISIKYKDIRHLSVNDKRVVFVREGNEILYLTNTKDGSYGSRQNKIDLGVKNVDFYGDSLLLVAQGAMSALLLPIQNGQLEERNITSFGVVKEILSKTRYRWSELTFKRCHWVLAEEEQRCFFLAMEDGLRVHSEDGQQRRIKNEKGDSLVAFRVFKGDKGIVWASSLNQGIYGLDRTFKIQYHLNTRDGLLSNTIKNILPDGKEGIWLLSNKGVQHYNLLDNTVRTYTKQDGLPTHEINDIVLVDNRIWLSTVKGLIALDEYTPSKNLVPPVVYIAGVAINERDTIIHTNYNLEYDQNTILIKFKAIAYKSRGNFKYKYRMLGLDTTWIVQPSAINLMRFFQLNSGTYIFELKAINEDGVESEATKITFIIQLPYWETWWFRLSIILFVLLVVLFLVWNQIRAQQLRNRVSRLHLQALQSQMNPHFIFNVLTAVQNLWLQHKNEAALNMQSTFAKLLRKIFQYSSQQAITIEQEEEFLNNYLSLEQIRFEHSVKIDFLIDDLLLDDDYYIPPLLIQPIVENSFKHGLFHQNGEKCLRIQLKKEENYLYCLIEDNGVGRKETIKKEKRTSGLSTTENRLAILQESLIKTKHPYDNLKITDLKNKAGNPLGTKVEMWIPLVDIKS